MSKKRKRRRNRVTFRDVVKASRIVVHDPDFDPVDRDDLVTAIAVQIIGEKDELAFDWDKLLELIVKWLPIILALFV